MRFCCLFIIYSMSTPTSPSSLVERLFKAGAHFGFKKSRRHPTVAPYLFATKQGSDIFDLEQSVQSIETAKAVLKDAGSLGKTVLFVGTKSEVMKIVQATAESLSMPFVVNRWIGGMLTNLPEIKKRIARLEELNREREAGELDRKYTKKERVIIGREVDKLNFNFAGIAAMAKMPDLMVVIDPRHDAIAVAEARDMKVPVVAIASSDCDITKVTYPVVVNDSLQASVSVVLKELADAFAEGRAAYVPAPRTDVRSRAPRA